MPCRPAISSLSLGLPHIHPLPTRLDQAARHNLDIELFHDDILEIAKGLGTNDPIAAPSTPTDDAQLQAARIIRNLCDTRSLNIVCLQPFRHYEGLLNRSQHAARLKEITLWIQLVQILGTDLIGIPSTFLSPQETSASTDLIVSDLRELADLGSQHGIRFTYEALAWGTHIDTWEACWDVVKKVDRPNFGICLDTFNLAGRVYADPTARFCVRPNARDDLAASLQRLKERVDVAKVFWVQVVDAERLTQPLDSEHPFYVEGQPARMSWSRNCRLFYGEKDRGAFLPIKRILEVIVKELGFNGCLSAELFNRSVAETDEKVPEEHAARAAESFRAIVRDFGSAEWVARVEFK